MNGIWNDRHDNISKNSKNLLDMKLACFNSFQPKPVTIDALAHDTAKGLIAQSRSDGSIHLLDDATMAVVGQIPTSKNRSVRRLLFYKSYLLSCGVHGSISMWDLKSLVEVATVESSQGAVWDMALDGDKLYLATETGSVAVVELSAGDMRISSFLRQSSKGGSARALSVCVESGHVFVGDARGTISRWTSGSCDSTFAIPPKNNIPTLIWQLVSCGGGLIASGDSLGCVSLWDAKSCTLVQTRHDHQADILIMTRKGEDLYTSGVDARVARYRLGSNKLTFVSIESVLSRDVSAMAVTNSALVLGGSDARLGVSSTSVPPRFQAEKLDRFVCTRSLVRNKMVFVKDGSSGLKVFKLDGVERDEFFAVIEGVENFSVSQNGSRLITVSESGKVARFSVSDSEITEVKDSKLSAIQGTVTCLAINDRFSVVAIAGTHLSVVEERKSFEVSFPKIVTKMTILDNMVVCASGKEISLVTLSDKKPSISSIDLNSPVTAVSEIIDNIVLAATADNRVHVISIPNKSVVSHKQIPNRLKFSPVRSIQLDDKHVYLFGESYIFTADWSVSGVIGDKFKHNSAVPTGGVVVGSGKLDAPAKSPKKAKKTASAPEFESPILAVLASYKSTAKALIAPFERKQFQE